MATCKMMARSVCVNPYQASGTTVSEAWCETHQMHPNESGMCPVGQIEKARDEALEAIKQAKK